MKQGQFNKKFYKRNSNLASSRSGQAMIEYVLLLFVTISLIMMAKTVMGALGAFMDGYMGRYVRCLMDHGELPNLGIEVDDLKKNTKGNYVCSKQYSFSVQTGFQATNSGSSGEGGGSGSSSSASSKSKSDSSDSASKGKSDSSASEGSTSGSSLSDVASRERKRRSGAINMTGSSSADNGNPLRSNRLRSADGGEDDYSESKSRVIADASSSAAVQDSDTARSGRARYRTVPPEIAERIEKNSKRAQTNSKTKLSSPTVLSESSDAPGPRKSTVPMYEPKPPDLEGPPEPPFSFAKYFKWFIIIIMVIMIVIFFGGQILNYSKSDN